MMARCKDVVGYGRLGLVLGVISAIGMALGGCSTVPQSEYDLVVQENTELRQRQAALQRSLDESESRYAAMIDENQRLAGDLDRRRGDFEGMDGVTTGRRGTGEMVVGIAGDVLFDSGSATLKNDAKRTLDRIAQVLNSSYAANQIRVEGYTDTDPIRRSKWETNRRLGAERAMAVEEYLVSKGVDNRRIYSATFGEIQPKGTKAQSRRVEIVLLASGS